MDEKIDFAEIMTLKYSRGYRFFLLFIGVVFFAFSNYSIISEFLNEKNFGIIFFSVIIFAFSIISILYSYNFMILINNERIVSKFYNYEKVIYLDKISKILLSDQIVYFSDGLSKIGVSKDLTDQKKAIVYILEKLKDKKEVIVKRPHNLKLWLGEEGAREFMEGRDQQ